MTSSELYQWMADPSLLSKESLVELRQMVDDYPYFQAVRMLYLKNLAALNDVRLDKELKKMSIHIPDRKKLFMLVKGFDRQLPSAATPEGIRGTVKFGANAAVSTELPDELPDELPSDNQADKQDEPPVTIQKSYTGTEKPKYKAPPADYIGWLESNADDIVPADGSGNRLRHQDIIDSYLEKGASQLNLAPKTHENEDENGKTAKNVIGEASIDDSYFTETLARVYIQQKRFDKALEIIRVLSLKYPEKNIYFADQIRYLERLINLK